MNLVGKAILAVIALLPIVSLAGVLLFALGVSDVFPPGWSLFSVLAVIVAATPIFLWHLSLQKDMEKDRKVLWALVLVFGNCLVFPVYWWRCVRGSTT